MLKIMSRVYRRTIASCPYNAREELLSKGKVLPKRKTLLCTRSVVCWMIGVSFVSIIGTIVVLSHFGMVDSRRECLLDAMERYNKPLNWHKVFTSVPRSSEQRHDEAYVCIATANTFAKGCMVVIRSLYRTGTSRDMLVLITKGVSEYWRTQLAKLGGIVKLVETIPGSLKPWHEETMIKFRIWQQTQYKKIVYIDADTIVLKNCDDLFKLPEFSATYDPFNVYYYEGRILNSALFVAEPSVKQFDKLMYHLTHHRNYMTTNIGDGNIFNEFFPKWRSIHASYLVVSHLFEMGKYRNRLLESGKIIHFSGTKPYFNGWFRGTSSCKSYSAFLLYMWDVIFDEATQIAEGTMDREQTRFDFLADVDV